MYFKSNIESPIYDKMDQLAQKMAQANNDVLEWVQKMGGTAFRHSSNALAGGICCVTFPEKPKMKGWVKMGRLYDADEYGAGSTPAGTQLEKEINALPIVPHSELNEIVGYDWRKRLTNKITLHPGYTFVNGWVIFDFPDPDHTPYTPVDGMIEITSSEYFSLLSTKPQPKKEK